MPIPVLRVEYINHNSGENWLALATASQLNRILEKANKSLRKIIKKVQKTLRFLKVFWYDGHAVICGEIPRGV